MTFSMMNPNDPIQISSPPASTSNSSRPAAVLSLLYSTLSTRLAQAAYAVGKGQSDSESAFRQAQAILADVRESIEPEGGSMTVRHLRTLLAYVAERLALSDDRSAALKEARQLIDPIAQAFVELAEAGSDNPLRPALHS